MMELFTVENLAALVTLTMLEITLGVDNIVFIVLITGRLAPEVQERARRWGLIVAMLSRVALLFGITWVMRLSAPLFAIAGREVSGRDIILLLGGLFLLVKATLEIHERLEGPEETAAGRKGSGSFRAAVAQIMLLDIIFSLDSVITAVGMAQSLTVMVLAIMMAVGVMLFFAGTVSRFIEHHPTMKMLAMAFLLLIGVVLVAEGMGKHIPRGYIYFAMAFSLGVEMLNLRVRRDGDPIRLRQPTSAGPDRQRQRV